MTTYIGIDAGTVSGFVLLGYKDKVPAMSEYADVNEMVHDCAALMMAGTPTVFFYEKFEISQRTLKTNIVYDTLLFNGWLHHEGRRFPYITTKGYTPAQSKKFSTDDKLKTLGWHKPSKGGHQNDAARILLRGLAELQDHRVMEGLRGLA